MTSQKRGEGGYLQKVTKRWQGGGGVSAKGDVIYEQKYGGPNQPYDVIYE